LILTLFRENALKSAWNERLVGLVEKLVETDECFVQMDEEFVRVDE
jgi:hypothetical protein